MTVLRKSVLMCLAMTIMPFVYGQSSASVTTANTNDNIKSRVAEVESSSEAEDSTAQTVAASVNTKPIEESTHFTIATGYANGFYYMFGSLVTALASNPPGSLVCEKGGACGAENTIMVNLASEGSLANLDSLKNATVDSAFAQANISYWAYTASGIFAQKEPQQNLRAIASFYPEMIHLVVRKDSGINTIKDLNGKSVSLGANDSGTLINVHQVLGAFGMDESAFEAKMIDLRETAQQFEAGEIDAFFFVSGIPTPLITHLAQTTDLKLIPIEGAQSDAFLSDNKYYSRHMIPAGTYPGIDYDVPTFAVAALWLTNDSADEELIYTITKAIWNTDNYPYWVERLLPIGGLNMNHALDGIGIPLHPGAKRYYNEIGKRF